jgi:porin
MKCTGKLFLIIILSLPMSEVFGMEMPDIFLEEPRKKLEEKGVCFNAVYRGDMAINLGGGLKQAASYLARLDFGFTFDLGRLGLIPGGKIYVAGNDTHGGKLPTSYIGDLQTVDNVEAPEAMRPYEWWYEQSFLDDKLSILAGIQGQDNEFAATDYGGRFIHSSFGTPPDLSANVPVSIFPNPGPALRVKIKPHEQVELLAGIYDGDPAENGKNRHNMNYRLTSRQGLMFIFEGAYLPKIQFNPDMKPLDSSIKFGSWVHTANLDDVISTDMDGNPLRHGNDYGFYGVVNQMIFRESKELDKAGENLFCKCLFGALQLPSREKWHEGQGLGAFLQFGGAPDDRNIVAYYLGAGLHYTGILPRRDCDVLDVAIANAFLSKKLRKAREGEIGAFDPTAPDAGNMPGKLMSNESTLETTYRIQLNDHLAIQPDYQIVFNPSGEQNTKTAHVFILRFEVNL